MIRVGIVDFDSSHCVEFTKRLNHTGVPAEQWVEGATVVVGCPGESKVSPERIPGYAAEMKKMGVPLVDKPADMLGKIDAVMIEAVDGSVHLSRAKPFLEAGVPCFVDKPFACSLADARAMAEVAAKKKVPLFTASSLRYAPEITAYLADTARGKTVGVFTYGPASLDATDRNPGWFHYGIHAVEMLYALLGPGCERVACTHEAGSDVATGRWKDGRIGTVRGNRAGGGAFGFTAFAEKGPRTAAVPSTFIYRELLKRVVETFKTGKPPLDVAESVEMVAFMEAANKSGSNHGAAETVKV